MLLELVIATRSIIYTVVLLRRIVFSRAPNAGKSCTVGLTAGWNFIELMSHVSGHHSSRPRNKNEASIQTLVAVALVFLLATFRRDWTRNDQLLAYNPSEPPFLGGAFPEVFPT